ncbi:MAG TPA: glycosyltransferase [Bryobacteraceae bacterium]|nr:glycosyltransferase [Bryobacteraceae bacterium]
MSLTSSVRPGPAHDRARAGTARKRVLIVAYVFPPENIVGALRPFRFSKSLPACGYDVTVLTSSPQPPGAPDYIRHIPRRRTFTEKVLRKFFVPGEDAIPWVRPAFRAAARMHAAEPFSAVFSTSPPSPVHAVALLLNRRFGIPWVADFRDPMRGSSVRLAHAYPYVDRVFEPAIFRRAGAVIANTDAVAESWKRRYPQWAHKVTAIWNGFDPDEAIGPAPIPPRSFRVLGHFGEIVGFRHPGVLLESVERLIAAGRLDPSALRIRLFGETEAPGNPETYAALRARGVVEELPLPPFAQAARLMAETDYLLLIDFTTGAPGLQVPSKLYTYIRIGRPVLAITTRNSPVERILGRSGIPHACIYPDSPAEEIDCRVLDFLSLPTDPVSASDWFWENFDCTVQTRTLASILDRLVLR